MSGRPRRHRSLAKAIAAVLLVLALVGLGAVWLNVLGVGDRVENLARRIELLLDPPPDRPIDEAVLVTPRPAAPGTPAAPDPGRLTRARRDPAARADPDARCRGASRWTWTCSPTRRPPSSRRSTRTGAPSPGRRWSSRCTAGPADGDLPDGARGPHRRVGEPARQQERRLGPGRHGRGPRGATASPGYEVRAYETRQDALLDGARAIQATGAPVILLTWRGAHTWVMTGFRADADPPVFDDARITGTYILDPWYPRVSSIWGASDPPGTLPGPGRDAPQLPALGAAGGALPQA